MYDMEINSNHTSNMFSFVFWLSLNISMCIVNRTKDHQFDSVTNSTLPVGSVRRYENSESASHSAIYESVFQRNETFYIYL